MLKEEKKKDECPFHGEIWTVGRKKNIDQKW